MKILRLMTCVLCAWVVVSCAGNSGNRKSEDSQTGSMEQRQASPHEGMPETTAESVWNFLEEQDYARTWAMWPGKDEFYEGTEPHGMLLTTYVDPVALASLETMGENGGQLPHGATIVKENYTPDRELDSITVMFKASEGYAPAHNNWFWMKRLADGTVEASGAVEGCQNCHAKSDNDYLMTPLP